MDLECTFIFLSMQFFRSLLIGDTVLDYYSLKNHFSTGPVLKPKLDLDIELIRLTIATLPGLMINGHKS